MTVTTRLQAGQADTSPPSDPVLEAIDQAGLPRAMAAKLAGFWRSASASHTGQEAAAQTFLLDLRRQRMIKPARRIARHLADAYPDEAWPVIELARLCHLLGDYPASLAAARRVCERFPADLTGPQNAVAALLALRQADQARAMLADLPPPVRRLLWARAALIQVAALSGDHQDVLMQCADLRAHAPDNTLGYVAACAALRALGRTAEAEALVQAGLLACPDRPDVVQEAALVAEAAGQEELALARWAALQALTPHSPQATLSALRYSRSLGQPVVTERLLAGAVAAFPRHRQLRLSAARLAAGKQRWAEADAHWRALSEMLPRDPSVQVAAAMSLIGSAAGRQRRMEEVLRRLDEVHDCFPTYTPAYAAHLAALREARLLEAAEACGRAWGIRFPGDPEIALARARVAQDVGRHAEAVALLDAVRKLAPASALLEAAHIRALSLAGRQDDAEQAFALAGFAEDARLLAEHVRLATRRGDLPEAVRRAESASRKRPQDDGLRDLLARTRALAGESDPAPTVTPAEDSAPPPLAALFGRFESLGANKGGCEFGLVQRAFGAAPLGLLRWASISVEGLTRGLQTGFDGIGTAEHLALDARRASADNLEYALRSDIYGLWSHTFVKVEDLPHDRMLQQSLRRMRFLQSKLVEDLQAAEKIFVFKLTPRPAEAVVLTLFEALRRHGPCTLLFVTLADANHPSGTLDMLCPGLFLGYSGMFMDAGTTGDSGIDLDLWRLFCEQVAAWHDSARAAAGAGEGRAHGGGQRAA